MRMNKQNIARIVPAIKSLKKMTRTLPSCSFWLFREAHNLRARIIAGLDDDLGVDAGVGCVRGGDSA